jgi:hypothetical protein
MRRKPMTTDKLPLWIEGWIESKYQKMCPHPDDYDDVTDVIPVSDLRAFLVHFVLCDKEPAAWSTFDGEGGYDLRGYEYNETYQEDYVTRNGEKYRDWVTPLYAPAKGVPDAAPRKTAEIAC